MKEVEGMDTNLSGRRLSLVRLAWAMVALLVLVTFFAAIPARLTELRGDPYGFGNYYELLGISADFYAVYYTVIEVLFALLFAAVACLIFWKASADWMAILVSLAFLAMGISSPLSEALLSLNTDWVWPILILRVLTMNLIVLIFFLFPSGRFVPGWTRWLAIGLLLYTGLWFFVPQLVPPIAILVEVTTFEALRNYLLVIVLVIVGIGAQIYRYRYVSDAEQRQQTKWVVLGFVAFFVGVLLILVPFSFNPALQAPGASALRFTILFGPALLLAGALIPLSFSLAILRYRLWDISIVVRRTLVYGVLTGLLILIYFVSVLLLQTVFTAVSGQRSPIAIVISTLIIAALFNPLRYRLQEAIDRRFFRRKYDATQTLAKFAATARDEVDLDRLTAEMLQLVDEAVRPEHLSLWLKPALKPSLLPGRGEPGDGAN